MQRILGILVACLTLLHATAGVAADGRESHVDDDMRYARRIFDIDRDLGPAFNRYELLNYPPFVALASEGSKNLDPCIKFLSREGLAMNQRVIAILSMHKLGLQDYLKFLRELANLFDHHSVSRDELFSAAIPGDAWSTLIIDNFEDEEVRNVLSDIARREVSEATKKAIESILSGEALFLKKNKPD